MWRELLVWSAATFTKSASSWALICNHYAPRTEPSQFPLRLRLLFWHCLRTVNYPLREYWLILWYLALGNCPMFQPAAAFFAHEFVRHAVSRIAQRILQRNKLVATFAQ